MAESQQRGLRPWRGGGREDLAAAVRRLISATVTSLASEPEMKEITSLLGDAAERLETYVPEAGAPIRKFSEHNSEISMVDAMPFDPVIGDCNPLAPPMEISLAGGKAVAHVTFGPAYEGAPGCVHGAAIAGAFDIILTGANVIAGSAGPTKELTIRFLRPTLVAHECTFEASVVEAEGRRIKSTGTLTQRGTVTARAEGEFVALDRAAIDAMHLKGVGG